MRKIYHVKISVEFIDGYKYITRLNRKTRDGMRGWEKMTKEEIQADIQAGRPMKHDDTVKCIRKGTICEFEFEIVGTE